MAAQVEVLDATTGEGRNLFTFPPNRVVISGAVSADERRVYFSYHGGGIVRGTGLEWFDLKEQGWQRGSWVASHGDFAVMGNVVLAATGSQEILRGQ